MFNQKYARFMSRLP